MASMDELRADVRRTLPEVELIKDDELRNRVVEAWAMALSETEFTSIDEMRASGGPLGPRMINGTQSDHLRGVTNMALAMADELEKLVGPIGVDRDMLTATGLCHDLGKPFEFSPRNQHRWRSNPADAGYPAFRHPVYGVHIALNAGLPEKVAHAIGAHGKEGENIERNLEITLVSFADHAFWRILGRAGLLRED